MYCAPIKPPKSARSVRAQRHTDMPKAQKVGQAKKKNALSILGKENCVKAGNVANN